MKIAYCFFGCAGGLDGKSCEKKSGSDIVIKMAAERIFKKLNLSDTFDFFIHTWDIDRKDLLISSYKPKKSIIEEQIIFNIPPHLPNNKRVQGHYSRWYSVKQSIKLKRQYELENNFKYDLVVTSRLDIYWLKSFDFNCLDNTKFNISQCEVRNKIYSYPSGQETQDLLLSSNSDYMDQFHTLYDFLDEYSLPNQCPSWNVISSHFLTVWHLKKLNLWDKVHYPFVYWYPDYTNKIESSDFTLVRALFPSCYRLNNNPVDYDTVKKFANI